MNVIILSHPTRPAYVDRPISLAGGDANLFQFMNEFRDTNLTPHEVRRAMDRADFHLFRIALL